VSEFTKNYRQLIALQAVASGEKVTQRWLAARLAISLGLANALLHELQADGLMAISQVEHTRLLKYKLTAGGRRALKNMAGAVAEEAGNMLAGLREELTAQARKLKADGCRRVTLCGEGALADMAACALMNSGLKLAGVVSRSADGERVAGLRMRPIADAGKVKCDAGAGVSSKDAAALRKRLGKRIPIIQLLPRAAKRRQARG